MHLKVGSPLPFKQESCKYFSYVLLASNDWGESCFVADCEHYLRNEEVTHLNASVTNRCVYLYS